MTATVYAGSPALRFAHTVRQLGVAARELDLEVPGFRCPPRTEARRTVTANRVRTNDPSSEILSWTVAVRHGGGRPWCSTVADMVDGVLAANGLPGGNTPVRIRLLVAALELDRRPQDRHA